MNQQSLSCAHASSAACLDATSSAVSHSAANDAIMLSTPVATASNRLVSQVSENRLL